MPTAYQQHLARLAGRRVRCGVRGGRWRVAVRYPKGWWLFDESLAVFDDIGDSAEQARVQAWLAEVLGVRQVSLCRDRTRPEGWSVQVER